MLLVLTIIALLPATEICVAVICCAQSVSNFTICLRDQVTEVLQLNSEGAPGTNASSMQGSSELNSK